MTPRRNQPASANATLLKGSRAEACAYVVERLKERLAGWRHDSEDGFTDSANSDGLFPQLAEQGPQSIKDGQQGLPPPPPGLIVAICEEEEYLEDCLVKCGLPPNFFFQRFRMQFPDKCDLIVEALDEKIRLGIPIAETSEENANNAFWKAGIIMAWAHQQHSEPAAIAFVPSPKWIECRMRWQRTLDRPDPPSDEGRFPSVALVSLKAVEQGLRRRREELELAALALPEGWRDEVIAAEEEQDQLRRRVETAAVNAVAGYYIRRGFDNPPKSRELDNVGWDLEFCRGGKALLRVEVKGTQRAAWAEVRVELTPNEIRQADNPRLRDSYRLAVVRDALRNPKCAIYARDGDGWRRIPDLGGDDDNAPVELTTEPSGSVIVQARNL